MRIDETPAATAQASTEQRLTGSASRRGLRSAPPISASAANCRSARAASPKATIEAERAPFRRSGRRVAPAAAQAEVRAAALPGSAAEEVGYLLDAHLAMLSNSRLIRGVDQRIADRASMPSGRCRSRSRRSPRAFAAMRDPYLAARIDDIRVVGTRLIRNLIKKPYVAYSAAAGRRDHPRRRGDARPMPR